MAQPKSRIQLSSGFGLAVLMAAAFLVVSGRFVAIALGPKPAAPGEAAPPFSGQAVAGGALELADFDGRVVLVDFWATWCPPCVASLPHLEELHQAHRNEGFLVLGVNQEPNAPEHVRAFLSRRGITFPSVFDVGGAIAAQYGVHTFPTSFLVDRTGRIVRAYRGVPGIDRVRTDVLRVLSKTPVSTNLPGPEPR